ncbi:hypothetical protein AALH95_08940 [Staphylococcus nepalensis]
MTGAYFTMNTTAKLETKLKGINRDVVIVALSPNINEEFVLKGVERLKHVYFNIFTDHDRQVFDNQAPLRVVEAVKYP